MVVLNPLTYDQRQAAHVTASARVAGDVPQLSDYADNATSEYPPLMTSAIIVLTVLALAFAFAPSAIRIYDAAQAVAMESLPHEESARAIAISMVSLAEIGMVIFSLAFAVLPTGRLAQMMLGSGIAFAFAIAIIGNWTQAQPVTALAWLETLAPPLIVIALSYVLKEQMLIAIRNYRASRIAFAEAVAKRVAILAQPEQAPQWNVAFATALREELIVANRKGRGAKERTALMRSLSNADWASLIRRELADERTFAAAVSAPGAQHSAKIALQANSGIAHESLAIAKATEATDETWSIACSVCDWQMLPKATERSAKAAMSAHMKKHKTSPRENGTAKIMEITK